MNILTLVSRGPEPRTNRSVDSQLRTFYRIGLVVTRLVLVKPDGSRL